MFVYFRKGLIANKSIIRNDLATEQIIRVNIKSVLDEASLLRVLAMYAVIS